MVDSKVLVSFLEEAKPWEKVETDIPGVFIVKVPGTKANPQGRLMVEINPINKVTGLPKKRKGLFVADFEMYLQFREALEEDRVAEVIKVLEEVNPVPAAKKNKKIKI